MLDELGDSILQYPLLFALFGVALAFWAIALARGACILLQVRSTADRGPLATRLRALLADLAFQPRMWRRPLAGAMHTCLMVGGVLALGSVFWTHLVTPRGVAWQRAYLAFVLADVANLLLLVGLALAAWRRFVRRELSTSMHDTGLWALFLFVALAWLGARSQVVALATPAWSGRAFLSGALGRALQGTSPATLTAWYGATWTALHGAVLGMALLLPLAKWRHVLLVPMGRLLAPGGPLGYLPPIDLAGDGPYGAAAPRELSRADLLGAWSCVRCGRCSDACPARGAGGSLDPLRVEECITAGDPVVPLAEQLGEAALWECTTCLACTEICPAGIAPHRSLLDLRRERVLEAGATPAPLAELFRNLERRGNPWGLADRQRHSVAEPCDVLVWVGCMGRHNASSTRALESLETLLVAAGLRVGRLEDERCCGDPARRAGNERLWRDLAEQNIAALSVYVGTPIVTLCPHCANTLGNEYRDLGAVLPVEHALVTLDRLLTEGRLAVRGEPLHPASPVSYHDPCYLGRGMGVHAPARRLLAAAGIPLIELAHHGREADCCGGGGAGYWMGEGVATRMAVQRTAAVEATAVGTCATACPYCCEMLSSAVELDDRAVAYRDLVQILAPLLTRSGETGTTKGCVEQEGVRA